MIKGERGIEMIYDRVTHNVRNFKVYGRCPGVCRFLCNYWPKHNLDCFKGRDVGDCPIADQILAKLPTGKYAPLGDSLQVQALDIEMKALRDLAQIRHKLDEGATRIPVRHTPRKRKPILLRKIGLFFGHPFHRKFSQPIFQTLVFLICGCFGTLIILNIVRLMAGY